MHSYTTRDGRVFEWGGKGVCICTKCDEIFNSAAAFDAHIKRATVKNGRRTDHEPVHDHSHMPRNSKGYKVISLFTNEGLDKTEWSG